MGNPKLISVKEKITEIALVFIAFLLLLAMIAILIGGLVIALTFSWPAVITLAVMGILLFQERKLLEKITLPDMIALILTAAIAITLIGGLITALAFSWGAVMTLVITSVLLFGIGKLLLFMISEAVLPDSIFGDIDIKAEDLRYGAE